MEKIEIKQDKIISYSLWNKDSSMWEAYFKIGDKIYNPTITDYPIGYYVYVAPSYFTGPFTKAEISPVKNIPIFLEEIIEDLGVMIGFDGEMYQIEQKCNFTYSGSNYNIIVYNTVNTTTLPALIDVEYILDWGDGSPTEVLPAVKIGELLLPYSTHTYSSDGTYKITITLNSAWKVQNVQKEINIPFINSYGFPTDLGTLIFSVPYSNEEVTQDYLQDYRELTGKTENAFISFIGIGKSRIDELKKYGSNNEYSGITITDEYTGYTIDGLSYRDYPDNMTYISGTTDSYYMDEIYNGMITRNEHFLGFVDEPTIFSDVFVDRGKLGVMEKNFRLSEIESTGEIENYGNGYFNIVKF